MRTSPFLAAYPKKLHKRLSEYQKRLQTYSFSIVLVKDAPIDVATEIFTRINVTGRPLSVFEIMVAKTFYSARDFDLADEYDKLIDRLLQVSYDTLPPRDHLYKQFLRYLSKNAQKRRFSSSRKGNSLTYGRRPSLRSMVLSIIFEVIIVFSTIRLYSGLSKT